MVVVASLYAILVWLLFFKVEMAALGRRRPDRLVRNARTGHVAADDTEYPAVIERPKDIEFSALRPGMSRTATVYAPNSAPLDTIGCLLLYGRALTLYLLDGGHGLGSHRRMAHFEAL
jgi:hypothetical protein